jgi:hypothetical protein
MTCSLHSTLFKTKWKGHVVVMIWLRHKILTAEEASDRAPVAEGTGVGRGEGAPVVVASAEGEPLGSGVK